MQKALLVIAFVALLGNQTHADTVVVGKDCADIKFRRMVYAEVNSIIKRNGDKYELIDLTDARTIKFNTTPLDIVCSYFFKFSDGDTGRYLVKLYPNSLGDEIIEFVDE